MPGKAITVAVVGGGIGGLSAALSLHQAGFDVHVYEQAEEIREVGAGIQISPNASRILYGLGLEDELERMGVRPLAWHQRRWDDGRTLTRSPLGDAVVEAFGFPYYQTHRADLQAALARALPEGRVHTGYRLIDLTDGEDGVEARFENGASTQVDVLVGADGIHSVVRSTLFGPASPSFTGCVAYRGLIPSERLADLNLEVTAQMWLGPGGHFVHYYVQSKRLVNFVAIVEQDTWTRESWTDRGEVSDALAAFAGWHPQVHAILSAVDHTFIWALFDRAPLDRWSGARATLLGDACHPMLPFMAQGAGQAIEDGAALTALLVQAGRPKLTEALRHYEQLRLPRTARIQGMARTNKTRFHLPDGPEQEERDAKMQTGATDFSLDAIAWIYGHDARVVEDVQSRP
jgi:salicylate hydroxylase